MMDIRLKRTLIIAVLLLIALSSILLAGKWMSSPARYEKTIASIDSKSDTVLKLTASSTLLSAGISALPDDMATPIADKLADFTEYFLLVLCVLYAEKFLLTVVGAGTFRIIIPLVCLLLGVGVFRSRDLMHSLAFKLVILALVLCLAIPLSIGVSDLLYDRCQETIQTTLTTAQQLTDESAVVSGEQEDTGVLENVTKKLSTTLRDLTDRAARMVNAFVESLAVMIVTSCVIPVLVLAFFLWLIKVLTGVKIEKR